MEPFSLTKGQGGQDSASVTSEKETALLYEQKAFCTFWDKNLLSKGKLKKLRAIAIKELNARTPSSTHSMDPLLHYLSDPEVTLMVSSPSNQDLVNPPQ
jgi:hypothetical protein